MDIENDDKNLGKNNESYTKKILSRVTQCEIKIYLQYKYEEE